MALFRNMTQYIDPSIFQGITQRPEGQVLIKDGVPYIHFENIDIDLTKLRFTSFSTPEFSMENTLPKIELEAYVGDSGIIYNPNADNDYMPVRLADFQIKRVDYKKAKNIGGMRCIWNAM